VTPSKDRKLLFGIRPIWVRSLRPWRAYLKDSVTFNQTMRLAKSLFNSFSSSFAFEQLMLPRRDKSGPQHCADMNSGEDERC
jgi:hypothetical protein